MAVLFVDVHLLKSTSLLEGVIVRVFMYRRGGGGVLVHSLVTPFTEQCQAHSTETCNRVS